MVSLLCLEASSFGLVESGKRIEEAQESTYEEAKSQSHAGDQSGSGFTYVGMYG
jgi:hypothetical protein